LRSTLDSIAFKRLDNLVMIRDLPL
jgi:hypothetical protein